MPKGVYKHKSHSLKTRKKMSKTHTRQFFCNIIDCNENYYAKGLCVKHYRKQYYKNNKEDLAKKSKKRRKNNKEQIAKQMKQYYQDNKKHYAEYGKQYREDNKEDIAGQHKQYRETPLGKISQQKHHHKRRELTKDLTKKIIQQVYEDNLKKFGVLTCYLCFKPIINNDDSLEHSIPLIRGGTNDYENLGIAHLKCNLQKGTKTLSEWFENIK